MANPLQPVRGTRDIIGEDSARHLHVVETARRVTALYGFSEWQTPIFEDTAVFSRTLGETSDVVTKEMYTFDDRGGDSITLRPEGTAGVCRALISNGLTQTLPQKVFYQGPMFRYERPQKGRYRQFHQIGVEVLGASVPLADAEVISCGWRLLNDLGLEHDVVLHINTLGDQPSRANYRRALVDYLSKHVDELSVESRSRLERNPLRILDSKDEGDKEICLRAPLIQQHLTDDAEQFYSALKRHLSSFGVKFVENPKIVRGLDYYNHTAFEFVTTALGAQGTVLAGGRYDGLVEQMGGPSVPGVGWAAGIDRLSLLLKNYNAKRKYVVMIPVGDIPESKVLAVSDLLRDAGIAVELGYTGSSKRRVEKALKTDVRVAVIIAETLFEADAIYVQDLDVVRQKVDAETMRNSRVAVPLSELPNYVWDQFKKIYNDPNRLTLSDLDL